MPAALAVAELMSAPSTLAPSASTFGSFMFARSPLVLQLSTRRVP